jgi:hypothetical protein
LLSTFFQGRGGRSPDYRHVHFHLVLLVHRMSLSFSHIFDQRAHTILHPERRRRVFDIFLTSRSMWTPETLFPFSHAAISFRRLPPFHPLRPLLPDPFRSTRNICPASTPVLLPLTPIYPAVLWLEEIAWAHRLRRGCCRWARLDLVRWPYSRS